MVEVAGKLVATDRKSGIMGIVLNLNHGEIMRKKCQ